MTSKAIMNALRKYGLLVVAIVVIVFFRSWSGTMDPTEYDAHCEKLLEEGKSAEALSWFREGDQKGKWRTISEYDNERSGAIIEEIYRLGAAKVTAADIDSDPDLGETTDILIVTLPEDPSNRAELLRYENRLARFIGYGGISDQGQKYLMLWWG